jgi:hypothetical protein
VGRVVHHLGRVTCGDEGSAGECEGCAQAERSKRSNDEMKKREEEQNGRRNGMRGKVGNCHPPVPG